MKTTAAPTRALVVEDDRSVSELGAIVLEELNLVVTRVATAEDAIEALRDLSGEIAVMLTDIRLPGPMNGLALAHRVSVLWPSISLIVTSGRAMADGEDLPPGAVYVAKPWRALDIVAAAERATREDHSIHSLAL